MFIESIARLIHSAAVGLSRLTAARSASNEFQFCAQAQPITLELDESCSPSDSKSRLTVSRRSNDRDPLYKHHDGCLRGSVSDRLECNIRENVSRWKLGRYVPHTIIDGPSTFFSAFAGKGEVPKALDRIYAPATNQSDNRNMIMSSQLKMNILSRYVSTSENRLQDREAATIDTTPSKSIQSQAFATSYAIDQRHLPQNTAEQEVVQSQAFATSYAIDQRHLLQNIAEHELDIENEICIFDPQVLLDLASSCDLSIADPIDAEVVPMFEPLQPTTVFEPKNAFQLLINRRKDLIGAEQSLPNKAQQRGAEFQSRIQTESNDVPGKLSSFDENRTYFSKPLQQYFGLDQVDTVDLNLTFDLQESLEDPWISGNQPVTGDEVLSPIQAATEDEMQCIRYIVSSGAQLQVLRAMSENRETAPYVLLQLAYHPDVDVRCAVANNTNAPLEARWMLALDDNQTVRYMVAENINTPAEVLAGLTQDGSSYVSSRARRTLSRVRGNKVISVKFGNNVLHLSAS